MKKTLTIVSRKSPLALCQANIVKIELEQRYPELTVTIFGIQTEGDKILDVPLAKIGGKGLFVKALEDCLLKHEADIAVHSLKDMPTEQPEGLELCAILKRGDPRDAFVSSTFPTLRSLPPGAVVGTSSLRRQAQLLALRNDIILKTLRGNVNTRLTKLKQGEYDAIVLATAGLQRLGLENEISDYFSPQILLPAPGQAALCIECRDNDHDTKLKMAALTDYSTQQCVLAERSLLRTLKGNCQSPIAGFATQHGNQLTLHGMVAKPDGTQVLKAEKTDGIENAIRLGQQVAQTLFEQGAQALITDCQQI